MSRPSLTPTGAGPLRTSPAGSPKNGLFQRLRKPSKVAEPFSYWLSDWLPFAAKLSRESWLQAARTFALLLVPCALTLLVYRVASWPLPAHGVLPSVEFLPKSLRGVAERLDSAGISEPVNCSMGAQARMVGSNMVLLTSNGLSNEMLKESFRELVSRLPGGRPGGRPEAVSDLNVLVIEDPCFLKHSFWNQDLPAFHQADLINYRKSGMRTDAELVRPFLQGRLDGGTCADWKHESSGLVGMGFNASRFHHVSLFDRLAPEGLRRAVFQLQATGDAPAYALEGAADAGSAEGQAFLALLKRTSVVIVNGGNPDFANYVFHRFAAGLAGPLRRRLADGKAVMVGRSAGSMVASADIGLTYETGPAVLRRLSGSTSAMGLTGRCTVRPHFAEKWYVASLVYATLRNLTAVLVSDGQALRCAEGDCRLVGRRVALPEPRFDGPGDPRLIRLAEAFRLYGACGLT